MHYNGVYLSHTHYAQDKKSAKVVGVAGRLDGVIRNIKEVIVIFFKYADDISLIDRGLWGGLRPKCLKKCRVSLRLRVGLTKFEFRTFFFPEILKSVKKVDNVLKISLENDLGIIVDNIPLPKYIFDVFFT